MAESHVLWDLYGERLQTKRTHCETDFLQALSFGMMANLGAFTLAAPHLGFITVDLKGSPGSITWAAIVYVLMQGVGSESMALVTLQIVVFDLEYRYLDRACDRYIWTEMVLHWRSLAWGDWRYCWCKSQKCGNTCRRLHDDRWRCVLKSRLHNLRQRLTTNHHSHCGTGFFCFRDR